MYTLGKWKHMVNELGKWEDTYIYNLVQLVCLKTLGRPNIIYRFMISFPKRLVIWGQSTIFRHTNTSLVGGIPTPLKKRKSVGIVIPNIWKVIKFMFQTTNQNIYIYIYMCVCLSKNMV